MQHTISVVCEHESVWDGKYQVATTEVAITWPCSKQGLQGSWQGQTPFLPRTHRFSSNMKQRPGTLCLFLLCSTAVTRTQLACACCNHLKTHKRIIVGSNRSSSMHTQIWMIPHSLPKAATHCGDTPAKFSELNSLLAPGHLTGKLVIHLAQTKASPTPVGVYSPCTHRQMGDHTHPKSMGTRVPEVRSMRKLSVWRSPTPAT